MSKKSPAKGNYLRLVKSLGKSFDCIVSDFDRRRPLNVATRGPNGDRAIIPVALRFDKGHWYPIASKFVLPLCRYDLKNDILEIPGAHMVGVAAGKVWLAIPISRFPVIAILPRRDFTLGHPNLNSSGDNEMPPKINPFRNGKKGRIL